MNVLVRAGLLLALCGALAACQPTPTPGVLGTLPPQPTALPTQTAMPPSATPSPAAPQPFALTSSAFAQEGRIPAKYTCNGEEKSPPLAWNDPPAGAQSFALIIEDPDAPLGVWTYWVLYNIPPSTRALAEGVALGAALPDGSRQGANSVGRSGYSGLCPSSGTHRYFFRLYALDRMLAPDAGKDKKALISAMEGHILAQVELLGSYGK